MADTSGVLSRLLAALSVYDPTWDTGIGTATYKIFEAAAQEIALANNNSTLQTYSYDINTKFGNELDAFCNLFGVYRMLGKRASGIVTFSINAAATAILDIPIGTQVAVPIGGNYLSAVYFSTTAPAIIGVGDTSVDVPVVASLPGVNGNVPAGTIISLTTALNGITSVNNNNALSGGLDPESDTAFRSRWVNTAFSNVTGTASNYVLTGLQDPNNSNVNAVSAQSFYSEQLQIGSTISGTSSSLSGAITLLLVAYSGQTINNISYSGTTTVASGAALWNTNIATLSSTLNTMISGVFPNFVTQSGFVFSTSATAGASGVVTSGINITANMASPYRLTLSGATVTSGIASFSGTTTSGNSFLFYDSVTSNNPDIGYPGTLSYNGPYSGYLYPQGNELVGSNLNTANQTTYANLIDYYYPNVPTAQLRLIMANGTANPNLFVGNVVQVISEYCAAANRSTTIASGNYIDIFIDGTSPASTTEQLVFNPIFTLSGSGAPTYLNLANYTLASGSVANTNTSVSGDIYVPLNKQPVINFPAQLSTSSSGLADTIYLYNAFANTGAIYPIAANKYPNVSFTGTTVSGSNFVTVTNANSFLYPGIALSGTGTPLGSNYFIQSVSSSGIVMNNVAITSATNTVINGKAIAYPLYDTTDTQDSVIQITGLAFDVTTPPSGWPTLPTSISWATYTHAYNNDVATVEALVQQSRPLGANTLVHQANYINLVLNLRIVFSAGYSIPTVETSIFNQLSAYFSNLVYLSTISFANLASQVLSVGGVANVRVLSVGIVSMDGTIISNKTSDFLLASNQLPTLYNINYIITGSSTF